MGQTTSVWVELASGRVVVFDQVYVSCRVFSQAFGLPREPCFWLSVRRLRCVVVGVLFSVLAAGTGLRGQAAVAACYWWHFPQHPRAWTNILWMRFRDRVQRGVRVSNAAAFECAFLLTVVRHASQCRATCSGGSVHSKVG